MRWFSMLAVGAVLLGAPAANADIPAPPKPRPTDSAPFVVEVDPNVRAPRLIVPRNLANRNAGLDLPADGQHLTGAEEPSTRPMGGTLLAGLSLAAGAAAGGLWLVRRNRRGPGMALMAIGAVVLAGSAAVYADIAPFPRPRPRPQPQQFYSGRVAVEIVAQGDTVRLVLPPQVARQWRGDGAAPGAIPGVGLPPGAGGPPGAGFPPGAGAPPGARPGAPGRP